jgi:fructose-1,6-bisphosphatase/inositol monophosphatase family enzyme
MEMLAMCATGGAETPLPVEKESSYEHELAWARRVILDAGDVLTDSSVPGQGRKNVLEMLDFEFAHETVSSFEGSWAFHVDDEIVSVSFIDPENVPVVGVVCRPWTKELLYASAGGGAFHQIGDNPPVLVPEVGFASTRGTVLHTPYAKFPALEMAIESLEEKMTFEVTRTPCCCCCEGLFEVVCGRADVHLSPPEECSLGHRPTPGPVLCAFDVLLRETGGHMTACNGDDLDYASLVPSGEHRGGILASNYWTHNYMLHGVREAFANTPLALPRLSAKFGLAVDLVGDQPRIFSDPKNARSDGSDHFGGEDGFNSDEPPSRFGI